MRGFYFKHFFGPEKLTLTNYLSYKKLFDTMYEKAKGSSGTHRGQAILFASQWLQITFIDFTPHLFIVQLAYVSSNHKPS